MVSVPIIPYIIPIPLENDNTHNINLLDLLTYCQLI